MFRGHQTKQAKLFIRTRLPIGNIWSCEPKFVSINFSKWNLAVYPLTSWNPDSMNATMKSSQSATRSILSSANLRNGKLATNSPVTFVCVMRVVSLTNDKFYTRQTKFFWKVIKKAMCCQLHTCRWPKKVFSTKYRQLSILLLLLLPVILYSPVLTKKIRPSFSKIVIFFINYF